MHYLVIHRDSDCKLDIAEVEADNVKAAVATVAAYSDTDSVISAIESTAPLSGVNYYIAQEAGGVQLIGQLLPTEGNDLPLAEGDPEAAVDLSDRTEH